MKKTKVLFSIFIIVVLTITSTAPVSAISYVKQQATIQTNTTGAVATATFTPTPFDCSATILVTTEPANSNLSVYAEITGEYIITLSTGEIYYDTTSNNKSDTKNATATISCPSNARWNTVSAKLTLTCNKESKSASFSA